MIVPRESEHHPDAVFLFSEDEGKRGRGTINPKTLGELVKDSMRNIGMRPTCSGGYYRFHDLRKVWCDWMDKGGASLEQMSAFLGHSSTKVTFQHYFSEDHKRRLGQEGWEAGMGELEALIQQRERIDHSIDELYRQLHDIGFFSDGKGGGVYPACWDEDDDMLVRAPGLEPGTP